MKRFFIFLIVLSLAIDSLASESLFTRFVYRDGDKLMDENREMKFLSFNIPCLHYNEDVMDFKQMNPWRTTNEFEITDALEAIRQMGGQVVRIYSLSVRVQGEDPNIPRHITGPGQFDDETFKSLDTVLAVANKKGIRVIIPFIDNWKWWGGIGAAAAFRGKSERAFWTDEELFQDYIKIVEYVINRTNSITGVKYKDDKAILAWETGNELNCTAAWTSKAAAAIKALDKNHLVLDGYSMMVRRESLADDNIDMVTTHHYAKDPQQTINMLKRNAATTRDKKPYFVGEFGFLPTDAVKSIVDCVVQEGLSGALLWSLRYRSRDGGFYWHSEPSGGDLYKAYHWPGFPSNEAFAETECLTYMRNKAFEIRGISVPPIEVPASPVLLNINKVAKISWKGSTGAQRYIVERSESSDGPWVVAGDDISDAALQYRPLFNDTGVETKKLYYYRVKAKNSAGISEPSNVVGPVGVRYMTLVDEMQDMTRIHKSGGELSLEVKLARDFKEDAHRLKGTTDSYIIYKVEAPLRQWMVYTFFPDKITDFRISVSTDGENFEEMKSRRNDYFAGKGEYDYYKPVLFSGAVSGNYQYLKIEYPAESQISCLEIEYGK